MVRIVKLGSQVRKASRQARRGREERREDESLAVRQAVTMITREIRPEQF